MPASRSDALLAYLSCGWPDPDPALIPWIQQAIEYGGAYSQVSSWKVEDDWAKHWSSIAPDNAGELLIASGLRDVRLTRKVRAGQTFPTVGEYCAAMLGEILLPVMAHAYLAANDCLDEDAVARAAKRTQKSLAEGKAVTVVARCMDHAVR